MVIEGDKNISGKMVSDREHHTFLLNIKIRFKRIALNVLYNLPVLLFYGEKAKERKIVSPQSLLILEIHNN